MTPAIKKMILKILKDTYNKIENDTCGLDEDEILNLANTLTHVKLNISSSSKPQVSLSILLYVSLRILRIIFFIAGVIIILFEKF